MKPLQPAGSPHRRGMPPSLLSPSSRSAFPAAAKGDRDAAVSEQEQPRVTLYEWWLATVEGDDEKLAVAGTLALKQILHELCPVPIAKRHSLNVVESEDGTILLLSGFLNFSRTLGYGYSDTVCKHFMVGFPHWWQTCNLRYPKLTNSDTGCQPCSSRNDSVFPKSSHLPNGAPRLEQHTCDGDIATNENAAVSSEAGKGNPSSEGGHDDIATDVSLAPTVQCTNNAVSEAVDSTPATDHKKTPVACLKNQGSWGENEHVASRKKPVGRPKKQISRQEKCQSATRSPGTRSPFSYILRSPLTRDKATSLSMSTPEDLKLTRTRSGRVIVPNLDAGCQSIVYGKDGSIAAVIGLDSPAALKWSESKTGRRKKRKTAGSESKTGRRKKRKNAGSESKTGQRKKRKTAGSESKTGRRKKRKTE